MSNKRIAFTLAEVLIVIAVIGIVASLTIPTLVQKYKERETVAKLKKVYSLVSQAYNLAIAENGTLDTWGLHTSVSDYNDEDDFAEPDSSFASREKIIRALAKYLKYDKIIIERITSEKDASETAIYLNDGTKLDSFFIDFSQWGTNEGNSGSKCMAYYGDSKALQEGCANFIVDINGDKEPNELGEDRFGFYITKNAIIPRGTIESRELYSFENACLNPNQYDRVACTAWVIENENMDYLHCDDLSWDGKHKCDWAYLK